METNEKVLAMYQAVHDLIMEGTDINRMKVSDITQKAGIGKGTAYEYFKSKEELIGRAIQYEFLQNYQNLGASMEKADTMQTAIECIFQWLEKNKERRNLFIQCMKFLGEVHAENQEGEKCIRNHMNLSVQIFQKIFGRVTELGRKEALIPESVKEEYAQLQILSAAMGFFVCIQLSEEMDNEKLQEMKTFLYNGIVKSLRE